MRTSLLPCDSASTLTLLTRLLVAPLAAGLSFLAALAVFLLVALVLGAYKGWRIYARGMPVYRDVGRLQEVMDGQRDLGTVRSGLPVLGTLKGDLAALETKCARCSG